MAADDCALCAGSPMDHALMRTEVWSDNLWRLTASEASEVAGFSYLEPRRHVADITELGGDEASTLGPTIAKTTKAIKEATGAELVYVYVFGDGVPHLHIHLAPHRSIGSPLVSEMIKGAKHITHLASGEEVWVSDRYPLVDSDIMQAAIEGIRKRLNPGQEPEALPDSPPTS